MPHHPSDGVATETPIISPFYTTQEVARLLRVDQTTVQGWIRDGRLRGVRFGRLWRISHADLEAFVAQASAKAPAAEAEAPPA